ncbi:glycogen/starch/alpha-glucan phosphorylase [Roseobacter denitrificans]|uniref:Alpha-1,4 glucan phosphorylase n=1 Tax=Roseobacter denitrificans (strain ATCC 33942 / OCh 114) TaxID=375451 RepID=Q165E1_ROSDO|nr:glycogen/starch/alpha-glucan phosphorylase [Roseobacter denitrificans]ABG32402.1 glycogen phosphorylase [Roseobacter denitrificans OCh 114]
MTTPRISAPSVEAFSAAILRHLKLSLGKDPEHASLYDWRMSLALSLRDHVVEPWFESTRKTYEARGKRVYYLSMEFLIGRLVEDVAVNLGFEDIAEEAITALGQNYGDVVANEPDAALGNGGLGRLAACFMDSLSTLGIPAYGYGIRYEHGLFEQHFEEGAQIETAETWLSQAHVWEFERPEVTYPIHFGGHVAVEDGKTVWHAGETVMASAYDTPVLGWQGRWANTLRLWAAKPTTNFDLESFNRGDYIAASAPEALARTISRVLYPDDTTDVGKELRLKQEYFFTSASLQDLLRRFLSEGGALKDLPDHVAIQLNDTHPAIAGPELVRLLMDEHQFEVAQAITTARACLAYTNHTLLPEALERWPEDLFARVLPRHYRIIQLIEAAHFATAGETVRIFEHGEVKMGELAFVMAHHVNGVSALHSELVKETVFSDLNAAYPGRIINQTNGITPRRWLYTCNRPLRGLINDTIGTAWPDNLDQLSGLTAHVEDSAFLDRFQAAKDANKARLADWLKARDGVSVDPAAMFDVQIKRIHEYKRQLMNLLETVALWNDIRANPNGAWTPRVKLFGGKAAPGYVVAKEIIHLINDAARVINADPVTREFLQIVYPENYNVSMAEMLIPAADLSEQISTAGKEASGTGNMKFALNGAPTIGTLDGANVEIRDCVGAENFFLFGLTAAEVTARRAEPDYARTAIAASPRLSEVLDQIRSGLFSGGDRDRYVNLVNGLYDHDYFLVTCDFDAYFAAQRQVDTAFADSRTWTRMAALNTARVGWFSSDRTISGYAKDIWQAQSLLEQRDADQNVA